MRAVRRVCPARLPACAALSGFPPLIIIISAIPFRPRSLASLSSLSARAPPAHLYPPPPLSRGRVGRLGRNRGGEKARSRSPIGCSCSADSGGGIASQPWFSEPGREESLRCRRRIVSSLPPGPTKRRSFCYLRAPSPGLSTARSGFIGFVDSPIKYREILARSFEQFSTAEAKIGSLLCGWRTATMM